MGGSHREAAEVVALERELERRRGLWWQELVRQTHRQWRRVGGAQALVRSRGEQRKEGAGGGRRLFKRLGGAGQRGEKGGVPCGRVAEGEGGEGAPGATVGSMGQPATAPDRQARAAALLCNKGERRDMADAVRARLTGGAGMSRGPSVSDGVREGEG
jgi:hypothetical protein